MAINLLQGNGKKLVDSFVHESYTAGKASEAFEFNGYKSIKIMSAKTQPLNDYLRSGTERYGTPTDVQDTVQVMTLTQDKGFSLVIDKGDNSQQMMLKNAGKMMKKQQMEQVIPTIDKWNLLMWARSAGKVVVNGAPSKTTIVGLLIDAETYFEDNHVPTNDRYVYMSNAMFGLFRQASEFVGCDNLTDKMILKGYKGDLNTLKIVTVPASYMPTNVHFIATYKGSVVAPHTIHDLNLHENPRGIRGHVLEGSDIFDAFVVGENCEGVYINVLTAKQATTPTATKGETTTALAAGTGEVIKYTLDGTDPRYSATAVTYTAAFDNPAAGVVIKAFAQKYAGGLYNSELLEHTCE